jgi:hypothetical protein
LRDSAHGAFGCLVYLLYTAWQTDKHLHVLGTPHRLLNIGIIIAFGYIGRELAAERGVARW